MPRVGRYELGSLLGLGAFGETYKAHDGDQVVAVKLIKEEAFQRGYDLARYQREVRALEKVVHENVVRLVEAGLEPLGSEMRYYVAMEYLEGHDLERHFRESGLSLAENELVSVTTQTLAGLKAIHDHSIVHRDLKPPNVFICADGTVKLLDFGLVRMLDYTTLTTVPGQAIGTPMYIAPEVLRGEQIDYRADLYSLGVMLYYLTTSGHYPFEARSLLELAQKAVNNPPTPPTRYTPRMTSHFEDLVLELLGKQPFERTLNHEELASAVRSTPLYLDSAPQPTGPVKAAKQHPKTCWFRLLGTDSSELRRYLGAGESIDGAEVVANFLPRYRRLTATLHGAGTRVRLDPVCYRLQYSSFAQTQGVVSLPYVIDPRAVLTPSDLQSLSAQREYVRQVLGWQLQWQADELVAPFHFSRDLGSQWLDINIKLLEEAIAYRDADAKGYPLWAGVCTNIEGLATSASRLALVNRYSRARPDGWVFFMDSIDERTNNPLQLHSYLELLRSFQHLGAPVTAARVGTLGLALMAAGVDGCTTGIASLSSFSESTLLASRATGYDMSKRYYVPGLMLTLPVPLAHDILSHPSNSHLRCGCPFCEGALSVTQLERAAKPHFLWTRTREVAQLNEVASTGDRRSQLRTRVEAALSECQRVRHEGHAALQPTHFSHLRVWPDVF